MSAARIAGRGEAGYVTLFVLGVSMGVAALIGIVLDGGRAQRAQSDCFRHRGGGLPQRRPGARRRRRGGG